MTTVAEITNNECVSHGLNVDGSDYVAALRYSAGANVSYGPVFSGSNPQLLSTFPLFGHATVSTQKVYSNTPKDPNADIHKGIDLLCAFEKQLLELHPDAVFVVKEYLRKKFLS